MSRIATSRAFFSSTALDSADASSSNRMASSSKKLRSRRVRAGIFIVAGPEAAGKYSRRRHRIRREYEVGHAAHLEALAFEADATVVEAARGEAFEHLVGDHVHLVGADRVG